MTLPSQKQPWIRSASFDGFTILFPSFLSVIFAFFYHLKHPEGAVMSTTAWVLLVVGIDVAHVYSTLYTTYFNSEEWSQRKTLYTIIPVLGWIGGVFFYLMNGMTFWRVLAYLAVFHFIRQQYGFVRIYSRKMNDQKPWGRFIDNATIYVATLYPIIYWHCHIPRNFHWFVDGDFVGLKIPGLERISLVIYVLTLFTYATKELVTLFQTRALNIPKNLLMIGTALSWYVGIITLNGDLTFTVTNIVAHGIPYMSLVWAVGKNRGSPSLKKLFTVQAIPLYLGILFLFSYLEEGLWDGLIWREHLHFFRLFSSLPKLVDETTLTWVVPLLALPQIVHYLLDGFIWKMKRPESPWNRQWSLEESS